MERLGVSVSLTSGYHPESNGQVERVNQEVGMFLRSYCHDLRLPSRCLLFISLTAKRVTGNDNCRFKDLGVQCVLLTHCASLKDLGVHLLSSVYRSACDLSVLPVTTISTLQFTNS